MKLKSTGLWDSTVMVFTSDNVSEDWSLVSIALYRTDERRSAGRRHSRQQFSSSRCVFMRLVSQHTPTNGMPCLLGGKFTTWDGGENVLHCVSILFMFSSSHLCADEATLSCRVASRWSSERWLSPLQLRWCDSRRLHTHRRLARNVRWVGGGHDR